MNCTICLKDIDINKSVVTPCNHRFCSYCFFRWIYTAKTCPLCRKVLIAEANTEEREELAFLTELSQQEIIRVNRLTEKIEEKRDCVSELYAEIEFLSTIKNQKKNEINKLVLRQQRVSQKQQQQQQQQQSLIRRKRASRRMGMMWA
jgi:hypothetical protein